VKLCHQYFSDYLRLTLIAVLITGTTFLIGCAQKTQAPETPEATLLSGTIVEIDDHGNAVTDLTIAPFTERGWELGDTLEATFATGQKIQIQFVENYGDVPEGDYLGRFSTSTHQFKIAINMGNIAESLKLENQSKVVLQKVVSSSAN
jgi:S-adenosylmethionine hydrolase